MAQRCITPLLLLLSVFLSTVPASAQFSTNYEVKVAIEYAPSFVDAVGSREAAQAEVLAYLIEADEILREQLGARVRIVFESFKEDFYSQQSLSEIQSELKLNFENNVRPSVDFDITFSFLDLDIEDGARITIDNQSCIQAVQDILTPYQVINTRKEFRIFSSDFSTSADVTFIGSVESARQLLTLGVASSFGGITLDCDNTSNAIAFCADYRKAEARFSLETGLPPSVNQSCDDGSFPYIECFETPSEPTLFPNYTTTRRAKLAELAACGEISTVTGDFNSVLPFSTPPNLSSPGDADGDNVSDSAEAAQFTNPNDRGSRREQLSSPIFVPWNGFLEVVNIIEVINRGASDTFVKLTLFEIDGDVGQVVGYDLAPGEQRDDILNVFDGFAANAYGVVRVEFGGDIDGRVFYYRPDKKLAGDYEFAFGIPFLDPVAGPTAVAFNTFQPAFEASESLNPTASWLSIINLASTEKRYTVFKHNQEGGIVAITPVAVPAFGRVDVEAGHINPGASLVGLVRILPDDNSAKYLAFLNRYGLTYGVSGLEDEIQFAFPLLALPGTGEQIHAPVTPIFNSAGVTADVWVEVINVLGEPATATVEFRDQSGSLLETRILNLAPYAQIHLYSNSIVSQQGYVSIQSNKANSIIAQSMFYFRDAAGRMDAMYGSQAREASPLTLRGTYNLFLEQESELTLINPSSQALSAVLTTPSSSTARNQAGFNRTTEGLRSNSDFALSPDSLGVLEVDPTGTPILAELLRIRISPFTGRVDYVAPTSVR